MGKILIVYYFTMKRVVSGNRLILKAICLGLALTLGASLMAAGAMAVLGCGMKCCCLSEPTTRHHAPKEQIRSSMDCCSGSSQMPCDLVAASEVQLPEISLTSSARHQPTGVGPAGHISDGWIDRHGFRGHAFAHRAQDKFRPPPLYLQNLSFLS